MRKPERLDPFYDELKKIHKEQFPDLRFGQFYEGFFKWLTSKYGLDPFYVEDDKMIEYIREYIATPK